jgi:hypothetical protein
MAGRKVWPMTNAKPVEVKGTHRHQSGRPVVVAVVVDPSGLYRVAQFLAPGGPVPMRPTQWFMGVALGVFPPPVIKRPRCSLWSGQQILDVLADLGVLLERLADAKREAKSECQTSSQRSTAA